LCSVLYAKAAWRLCSVLYAKAAWRLCSVLYAKAGWRLCSVLYAKAAWRLCSVLYAKAAWRLCSAPSKALATPYRCSPSDFVTTAICSLPETAMARKRFPPLAFRGVDAPYSRLGVPATPHGIVLAKCFSFQGRDNAFTSELGEALLAFLLKCCI
jgi:hypothetical protein